MKHSSKIEMMMLGLKETIGQLAITNSGHQCAHVLRRERMVMS